MTLKFCSFASGSSGNCYMITDGEDALLIDAGISGKRILGGLDETGILRDSVRAVLVTHEHSDHIKSLPIVTKKLSEVLVYANERTWENINRPVDEERKRIFITEEPFQIGGMTVKPFAVSHDAAEPVGFSIFSKGKQISLLTDSGCISEKLYGEICGADLLLLEANHEKEMLLFGRYPYRIKQRILGEKGHLSNISAGECLCKIIRENPKERRVILGHLSHENNTPEMAMQAIVNTLEESCIYVGGDLKLEIARRDCIGPVYEV